MFNLDKVAGLIPRIRQCPNDNCGQIITHGGGCKSMGCISCRTSFCFKCMSTNCEILGHFDLSCELYPEQSI